MFASSRLSDESSDKFRNAVTEYCDSVGYHDLVLTKNELDQLSWYMHNTVVTPSIPTTELNGKLHPEIKRGLARCYSFELLLRGGINAYYEFTQAQKLETRLDFEIFESLSKEARELPNDVKIAVRASCFLTIITGKTDKELAAQGIVLSRDSEEFLTQLADELIKNKNLIPLTSDFTDSQLYLLLKLYWPKTHLRHMMHSEGAENMTRSLIDGFKNKRFTHDDFIAWKWRWLAILFGFKPGYYDNEIHLLVSKVITQLLVMEIDPSHNFFRNFLLKRAELAGLSEPRLQLTPSQRMLLGHIAAYCNVINVVNAELGAAILSGYQQFKLELNDDKYWLENAYLSYCLDPNSASHTYVPAIMNNSITIFKNILKMSDFDSLRLATQFICLLFKSLYSFSHEKSISCMTLAAPERLKEVLSTWLADSRSLGFELDKNNELVATHVKYINEIPMANKMF